MRPPDDEVLLGDMLEQARRAVEASRSRVREDLDRDVLLAAGLERFVEVLGEAASRVSSATRASLPSIPWREIVGMRSHLIHGYATVDHNILWTVVREDLPPLVAILEARLGNKA